MPVSFMPTITVNASAEDWQLYGVDPSSGRTESEQVAVVQRLNQAAGEALTLAWSALAKDSTKARNLNLPENTVLRIEMGLSVSEAMALGQNHWDNVADRDNQWGATDTDSRWFMEKLLNDFVAESPARRLEKQNGLGTTSPSRRSGHSMG